MIESGLRRIPWTTMVDLGIPASCVAHYCMNRDMAYVDRRRILRHIRRARHRAIEGPLRVWWIRRLNAMERAL